MKALKRYGLEIRRPKEKHEAFAPRQPMAPACPSHQRAIDVPPLHFGKGIESLLGNRNASAHVPAP